MEIMVQPTGTHQKDIALAQAHFLRLRYLLQQVHREGLTPGKVQPPALSQQVPVNIQQHAPAGDAALGVAVHPDGG